jgi:hypothetical protein
MAPVTPGQAGNCDGGHRGAMTLRNRAQGVAQGQIAAQVRLIELRRMPAPVIFGKSRDVLPAEGVGQQAGLHWTVADHAGVMPSTPGDFACGGLAVDQRERRLQRIDMPDGFASFEQRYVEIADTC